MRKDLGLTGAEYTDHPTTNEIFNGSLKADAESNTYAVCEMTKLAFEKKSNLKKRSKKRTGSKQKRPRPKNRPYWQTLNKYQRNATQ